MERLLMFLVICVFAEAMENSNHTKYVRAFEDDERSYTTPKSVQKVPCSKSLDDERNTLSDEGHCGIPKKVMYYLGHLPREAHEEIYPEAVLIKQCVGFCSSEGFRCEPSTTHKRKIPLMIVSPGTSRERCATHTVEEHDSCGCFVR